jgi:hypothetical protein
VRSATFAAPARHDDKPPDLRHRVASEHLDDINNIALGISSDRYDNVPAATV